MNVGGWGNRWMFVRIPDMALDNPNLARGRWIRIECLFCKVWLRIGRYMILNHLHYLAMEES
jgi:hypothetical protein